MDADWTKLSRLAESELSRLRHSLPADLRDQFDTITVFMEEAAEDDNLGLFEGPAFAEESDIELPARMTLFLLNIWDEADHDEAVFRQEVRITLLHELGHYLGLNEKELADRELE